MHFARAASEAPDWISPAPSSRVSARRARLVSTAKPLRDEGMKSMRLKITIHLNGNHALGIKQLNALKPLVERGHRCLAPRLHCRKLFDNYLIHSGDYLR